MKQLFFLFVLLTGIGLGDLVAQPARRVGARKAIRRTATVILYAQKQVKEHKVYTGNLAKAVRHQRHARFLFRNGKYVRAIHHTRRARQLAFLAIQANKGSIDNDWDLSNDEPLKEKVPGDAELESELSSANLTDQDIINAVLDDIDVGENE